MKNGCAAYFPSGTTSATAAVGCSMAETMSTARNSRKHGLSTLPTHTRIFPGLSAKNSTAAKNASESSRRYSFVLPCGSTCSSPTVNDVVAQRGTAKNGPIVRYSRQVKPSEKPRLTFSPISYSPLERLMPSAATPMSGRPTPVIRKPAAACQICRPAI